MMMSDLLDGKVALITGASKGIGRALSIGFAAAGASVVCAARSQDLLGQVVNEIHHAGGQALAITADVTLEADVDRMLAQAATHFSKLDILVLNAGGNLEGHTVEDSDSGNWRKTIELNLMGPYYCARAAVPYLKRSQGGKVITLGSGVGRRGIAGMSAYACSKAGLWMLTRVLAQELQPYNISVNELIPGPVETGVISEIFRETVLETQDEWLKTPEDVVSMALFLATQPDKGPTAQSFSLMRRDN